MKIPYILFAIITLFSFGCSDDDNSATFIVGQTYGGGKIIYVDASGQHGIVTSESDQSPGVGWGCTGSEIDGASRTEIGTGKQNTIDILTECPQPNIAAKICDDLILNGYSDWYLPSLDELNLMFTQRDLIGGFTEDKNYWSSSEHSADKAWYIYFNSGVKRETLKSYTDLAVRAVRSF